MTLFHVPDIHCDGCIRALTGAARGLDAHATVHADLQTKQVQVTAAATDEAIAAAFREAGFDVEPA
jgi:copper chaperone